MKRILTFAIIILMEGVVLAGDPNSMATPTQPGGMTSYYHEANGVLYTRYKLTADEITTLKEKPDFFVSLGNYIRASFDRVVRAYHRELNDQLLLPEKVKAFKEAEKVR